MLIFHELAHCFWEVGHTDHKYLKWREVYDPEIDEYVYKKVTCRDLMHAYASAYKRTNDYWCYTHHFDLYLQQLHAIMSIGKPNQEEDMKNEDIVNAILTEAIEDMWKNIAKDLNSKLDVSDITNKDTKEEQ